MEVQIPRYRYPMFTCAAFVPATPLLVPAVGQGAADELADLRQGAIDAIRELPQVDDLVVLGTGPTTGQVTGDVSFAGFGLAGPRDGLSPALSVGGWLAQQAGRTVDAYISVSITTEPDQWVALGQSLAARAPGVGVVVVGDGSACRSDKAPGSLHPRAQEFDHAIVEALRLGDPSGLHALDPQLARELLVDGYHPWQVVASMVESPVTSQILITDDPYGVFYAVASWSTS